LGVEFGRSDLAGETADVFLLLVLEEVLEGASYWRSGFGKSGFGKSGFGKGSFGKSGYGKSEYLK
jgi:hypothetical protein